MKLIYDDDVQIKKVYLEFTQQCNLECTSCFRQNWDFSQTQMTQEVFDRCVEDLKTIDSLQEIVIGGIGEPTMHPKFKVWIDQLPDVKLTLTSNGFHWDDEMIDLFIARFHQIVVSIDGLDDTFKLIRSFELNQLEVNVQRLLQARKNYKQTVPFMVAQIVISEYNVDEIAPLIKRIAKAGFMKVILSNLLPQNYFDRDKILYKLHDNQRLKALKNKWLNVALSNQIQIIFPNFELKTERRCIFVEDGTLTINSDGQIAPCYRFAHPSIEYVFGRRKVVYPYYYGQVLDDSIATIWQSKSYTDLRLQNLRNRFPSCPDCDLVDSCDYINDSLCDCLGQNPSCADCLWTRHFIQCI
jgi:tungsten cofactor oxidoreducase radical SAM maturase